MRCFTVETLETGRSDCGVFVDDTVFTENELKKQYARPQNNEKTCKEKIKSTFTVTRKKERKNYCKNFLKRKLPIIGWVSRYSLSDALLGDIIAGLTVGIVHIPQGMAFALLAGVPPITGLYVSFFSSLIYGILGSSRHMSIGTFAVMSLMVGAIIDKHVSNPMCSSEVHIHTKDYDVTTILTSSITSRIKEEACKMNYERRKLEIAVAISLATGIIQVLFHIFHLGIVKIFLSGHLVSGFVCAASFHVMTSQIPTAFGISTMRHPGPLGIIYSCIDIFGNISQTNWAAVIITIVGVIILALGKEINSRFRKKLPFPLPFELVAVAIGIVASQYGQLESNYAVVIIGDLPTGFQVSVPKVTDIGSVFLDCISIATIAFTVEISLSEIMAKKHGYKIDSNQELLALGTSNMIGSFFSCIPCAASLSRTLIWSECGGKTQLAGLVSSTLIFVVIFWASPIFNALPHAVLAAIILVNLKNMMTKFKELKPLFKVSKFDSATWVVAWTLVIFLGVEIGLPMAVVFGLVTVVARTRSGESSGLGNIEGTEIYRDSTKYYTRQIFGRKCAIYQFGNPIYFANVDRFKSELIKVLGFDPDKEVIALRIQKTKAKAQRNSLKIRSFVQAVKEKHLSTNGESSVAFVTGSESESLTSLASSILRRNLSNNNNSVMRRHRDKSVLSKVEIVIFDMNYCPFVDNDGVFTFSNLLKAFRKLQIQVAFSNCNDDVSRCFKAGLNQIFMPEMFASTHDAVKFIESFHGIRSTSRSSTSTRCEVSDAAV